MLKITLCQLNFHVGDLNANAAKIIRSIKQAKRAKTDIVVFPELALTGYPPEDLLFKPHFLEANTQLLQAISKHTKNICAIVGFVDWQKIKGVYQRYNAAAILQDGHLSDIYHKRYLPNYAVFDEKRYFAPGESLSLYEMGSYRFSVSICEDVWVERFVENFKGKGLDFMINISASPFHLGKLSLRKDILSSAAAEMKACVIHCNLVGGQDELVFDGTSMVLSQDGKLIMEADRFREKTLSFNFKKNKNYPSVILKPDVVKDTFECLALGLGDYVAKSGFKKVIVGVSGGIDSAVVVSLAQKVLGRNNVIGLIMPSPYTSPETFSDAKRLCERLRIKYHVVDIVDILNACLATLKEPFKAKKQDKTEENLQARIRGNLLMAFSNKFGYLVLNTGNKSELSCGYCTLYGDMVGGFGVLKDIPKTLVYKLARHINRTMKGVIPKSILKRTPSAELRPNQKDTDTLPPYDILDEILRRYIEDDFSLDEIVRCGFKRGLVKRVIKMVDNNEYKRRQGPPGIKITPRAFGKDRRMPIVNKFSS